MSWFHEGLAEDERMDAYLRGDPRFQCRMSTEWGRRWTAAIRIRVPVRILHQLPPRNEGRLTRLHLHVEPISRSTTRRRHGAADRQSGGGGGLLKSRVAACHHRHGYDASAAVIHSFANLSSQRNGSDTREKTIIIIIIITQQQKRCVH